MAHHSTRTSPPRDVVAAAFGSFLLIGWTALLVPSLIREVKDAFGQSDAGMGLAYLLNSALYVTGSLSIGVLAGRLPRRLFLAAGALLVAVGLLVVASAGSWPVFLAGFLAMGLGSGIVDTGVNALMMDLSGGRAAMLNRLHVCFAVGALAAPLAVGQAVGRGVPWQAVAVGTAVAAGLAAAALATRVMPPVRQPSGGGDAAPAMPTPSPVAARVAAPRVPLPLVLLAVAIGCYVAMEIGISNWLVRFLEDAPVELATLALSLFWGALGLGRLVASFVVDRIGAVRLTATSAVVCGIAILGALVAPSTAVAIACFAVAGFAAGPVYPVIMATGGALHPGRASRVSSVLTSAAIVGSLVYPPLMGVVSEVAGLWLSMLGAAAFALASGAALLAAAWLARPRPSPVVA